MQLFCAEHLVRNHHDWACTAAPITDPLTGALLGVLDVSGPLDTINADTLRMGRCTVRWRSRCWERPTAAPPWVLHLPCVHPGRLRGGPVLQFRHWNCLVTVPPRFPPMAAREPLTLRRAEILALLDSRSQGWSAEELAYELHGDAGTPQAIRTEMFRVRSLLGGAVESSPYRLADGLRESSDSGRVLRLLREGRVAEALRTYTAPLLSRSGVLAVQLLRDQLDMTVGAAVRGGGEVGLLMRWLSTDMGAADTEGVKALGQNRRTSP